MIKVQNLAKRFGLSRRLLVVKLRAGREKDLVLCREVLRRGLVSAVKLRARLDATPLQEAEIGAFTTGCAN